MVIKIERCRDIFRQTLLHVELSLHLYISVTNSADLCHYICATVSPRLPNSLTIFVQICHNVCAIVSPCWPTVPLHQSREVTASGQLCIHACPTVWSSLSVCFTTSVYLNGGNSLVSTRILDRLVYSEQWIDTLGHLHIVIRLYFIVKKKSLHIL